MRAIDSGAHGCLATAACIIFGITDDAFVSHTLAIRCSALGVVGARHAAVFGPIGHTDGRWRRTARVIRRVTGDTSLVDTLIIVGTIGVANTRDTGWSTRTIGTHRLRTATACVIRRVAHRALALDALTLGTRTIAIVTA